MVLLHDMGQVESHLGPYGDTIISMQDMCTICAEHTIGSKYYFGRTWLYSKAMWIKRKFISICLEIVLISVQDSCTVCAECTTGMEIALDRPDGTPR
jgi:hypothetical protein